MIKLHKQEGFSLVELMIVVAIMAILAAIAIPSYLRFQVKARESEARTNLAAIKTCEESYKAENDLYLVCAANPGGTPGTAPRAWGSSANFTAIGFIPNGAVRYTYDVAALVDITIDFKATATGDVDGDSATATFSVTNATTVVKDTLTTY